MQNALPNSENKYRYSPRMCCLLITSATMIQNYPKAKIRYLHITLESGGLRRHLDVYSLYEFQEASKPCRLSGPVHEFFKLKYRSYTNTNK